jgi:hypothetical protein
VTTGKAPLNYGFSFSPLQTNPLANEKVVNSFALEAKAV